MMDHHHLPLGSIHDFSSKEAQQLLHNKFVVVMGDSIFRSVYKDLVYILQTDEMLGLSQLKYKGEETFAGDHRVEFNGLGNGSNYREVRQYRTDHHLVRFYFITRVYSAYMESVLEDFKKGLETELIPDVLVIGSCLWDLNRYQDNFPMEPPIPKALREYRQNLEKFFEKLSDLLPSSCLIIWTTATPLSQNTYGSIFKGVKKNSTPKDVIEANFYSACLASCYKLDILDLHFSFRFLEQHHCRDGVHWNHWVHRCITKLLLTHMAEAWGVELEKRELDPSAAPVPSPPENPERWHSTPEHPWARGMPRRWSSPGPPPLFRQITSDRNSTWPTEVHGQGPQRNGLDLGHEAPWSQANSLEGDAPQSVSYSGASSDRFEEQTETQFHWERTSTIGDSYFQQDASYGSCAVESYRYDPGPQPYGGQMGLSNHPPYQPWAFYGPLDGSGYPQGSHPGEVGSSDGHAFCDRPAEGGGCEQMFSHVPSHLGNDGSLPGSDADVSYYGLDYPISLNATFPPYNGWNGNGPVDGEESGQGWWPPPDEIGPDLFPPPRLPNVDEPAAPFRRPRRRAHSAHSLRGRRGSSSRSRRRQRRPQNAS
nr:PC-esterase domain-containing protein 1A-like isoform X1 [Pogona vitticeps]XP_020663288.1 PC-esterase domain-containing protein 1A-like isoform X1 [Pogona vitticeps]XP_020663289.1 PC-esterase domain-containing protein 1A-like isoform X1 [Pogona vitticeps]XP_020663290.1 PC-esterase domain-containing protein 1A-like isoform X1 [Pogona vitticeps]